ncbi:MAG: hypothetical protein GC155_14225 [Alphaproteobacteria bacterium]|nr:hypothetical protein [Alphaproteobacteria bacterium]
MRIYIVLAAAAFAVSCSKPAETTHFETGLSTQQVMKHIIDPAAVALWGRAGSVETEKGTEYLTPTSDEDWAAAENEAAIVAEGGNLLLLPGRAPTFGTEGGEWESFAHRLTQVALAVKAATAARKPDEMFKSGADLYDVCTGCHSKYYTPYIDADGKYVPPK